MSKCTLKLTGGQADKFRACSQAASIDSTGASQTPDTHQTLLENVSKCLFLHFYKDLVQAVVK